MSMNGDDSDNPFTNGQLPCNTNLPPNNQVANIPHLGPRWNGKPETFPTYKNHFAHFIDGIDPYLKSILENGPYIPFVVTPAVANASGAPGTSKITPK